RAAIAHFAAPGLAVHVAGALVQRAGLRGAGRRAVAGRIGPGVHPVARAGRRRIAAATVVALQPLDAAAGRIGRKRNTVDRDHLAHAVVQLLVVDVRAKAVASFARGADLLALPGACPVGDVELRQVEVFGLPAA